MSLQLELEDYEVQMLIDAHRKDQYEYADKQEYPEAGGSKRRADELQMLLKGSDK